MQMQQHPTHRRKSIRLKEYDYSQPGYYFITTCTHQRGNLFGEVEGGKVFLNESGLLINKIIQDLSRRFGNIEIDQYIIMPNHLHIILIISEESSKSTTPDVGVELALPSNSSLPEKKQNEINHTICIGIPDRTNVSGKIAGRASSAPTIPQIIQALKSISTIQINRIRKVHGIPVWQRNYYEHIIRNEKELYEIRRYIQNNPVNWMDDEYFEN